MIRRRVLLFAGAWVLVAVVATALVFGFVRKSDEVALPGTSVGERLEALKAERAAFQARADGAARLQLLASMRIASLLSDALSARGESAAERSVDRLAPDLRQGIGALEALNLALKDALARPGEGATLAARAAAHRAEAALAQLADGSDLPLVLSYTPRFVPPRRTTGELVLAPRPAPAPPEGEVRLAPSGAAPPDAGQPTVPRYAPPFATPTEQEAPVDIKIDGRNLGSSRSSKGMAPILAVGTWRGEASAAPDGNQLRFSVPRSAFTTASARTTLAAATLSLRREGRNFSFELPLVVLPDRPGSMALDQKVRTLTTESNTLVSPEILARAGVGENRTVHRCFDPPQGWRFDSENRRVVVVERLAWVDDVSDSTMNAGTVEFATGKPDQICVDVTARPASKTARTATIGRFEATLLRDKAEDRTVRTGVRALDWSEPVRLPLDADTIEWKLYVRLFDEVDREFDGARVGAGPVTLPFLRIELEGTKPDGPKDGGKTLVLTADPQSEP